MARKSDIVIDLLSRHSEVPGSEDLLARYASMYAGRPAGIVKASGPVQAEPEPVAEFEIEEPGRGVESEMYEVPAEEYATLESAVESAEDLEAGEDALEALPEELPQELSQGLSRGLSEELSDSPGATIMMDAVVADDPSVPDGALVEETPVEDLPTCEEPAEVPDEFPAVDNSTVAFGIDQVETAVECEPETAPVTETGTIMMGALEDPGIESASDDDSKKKKKKRRHR